MLEKDERIAIGEVALRAYRDDDIPGLVEHINDEAITRFTIHIPHPYGENDALDFLQKNSKWYEEGTSYNLAIVRRKDDRVIGGIGLMNIEKQFHHAEIGYWLGKKYWGKGVTSRCVRAMVRLGFERLGLQRISAVIFSPNERSRKVLEKCGFVHEGTMRDRYVLDGKPVDGEIFSIISREYNGI
jgi:RimJ/RimL family protein N-acetyltransferase